MARLYANEDFPWPSVAALRRLGHDVLTIQEAGGADQAMSDEAVLAFACAEKRILLTLNRRHFVRLHQTTPNHYGIIVCAFDPDFSRLAERIHLALIEHPQIEGQLLRINRPGTEPLDLHR